MTYRYRTVTAFMEAAIPLTVGIVFMGAGFSELWRGHSENTIFLLVGVPVYAVGVYYTRRLLNERIEVDGETIRWYDIRGVNRITVPLAEAKKATRDRNLLTTVMRIDTNAGPIRYTLALSNESDLESRLPAPSQR